MRFNDPRVRIARRRYFWMGAPLLCAAMLSALCVSARAQTVTAALPLGIGAAPRELAVNPVTNEIYVLDSGTSTVTAISGATNAAVSIPVGTYPDAVAVDTLTNRIYVCNGGSAGGNSVSVIDGATNTVTATVPAGNEPVAVAVNPVTDLIYVANYNSNNVTVIDGSTNTTTTIAVGIQPNAVAVNPVTNKIYVPSYNGKSVTVIDGPTNTTSNVTVGTSPVSVAVNPVTNKIYVANSGDNTVTVIDGSTNATVTVAAGIYPFSLVVNPVTNQVYVACLAGSVVTVINGVTNAAATVHVGLSPDSLVVNPVTNKIYVADLGSHSATVIDGATNATTTLTAGASPFSVGENPVTNKIYVANEGGNTVTVVDGATNAATTVATGSLPGSVAINPATNKIYVANSGENTVTAIDGPTQAATSIPVGSTPSAVVVNPIANQIYVANSGDNTVTAIDGLTQATTRLAAGATPVALAVDPVTNRIYVANSVGNTVTVIDGKTHATAAIPVGSDPLALAVDPVTNLIYVANYNAGTVSVIDGLTNATATTITVGTNPRSVAVNPVTNQIYVANSGDNTVTAIDGATNATTTLPAGLEPFSVAVNAVTNTIYVVNEVGGTVSVINGATQATASVAVGPSPQAVAVNPVTNKIYVPSTLGNSIAVIDGATNTTTSVNAGANPLAVAVNPMTNQIYVVNQNSGDVTALTEQQVQSIPLSTTIAPLPGNQTSNPTPTFTFTASSSFSPAAPPPNAVYFQLDTWQGPWTAAAATATPGTFTGALPALSLGVHILYAFATDGQDASSTQIGGNQFTDSSPLIGNITAYLFLVTNQGTASQLALSSSTATLEAGNTALLTATIEDASGSPMTSGPDSALVVTFTQTTGDGSVAGLGSATASAGVATLQITGNLAGSVTIAASATTVEASVLADGSGNPAVITVTPGQPAKLAWTVQPSNTDVGQPISPSPQVSVEDQYGNVVTGDSGRQIVVAIATNPSSGQLAGTLTVNDASGVSTFGTLSINQAGQGYQLAASAANLAGATSGLFDITPIPTTTGLGSNLTAIRYSDGGLNLNATVTLAYTSGGTPAGSLAFQLVGTDGLACSGVAPVPRVIALGGSNLSFSGGKATATVNGIQIDDPCAWSQNASGDSYTLKAVFTSSNSNYANSTTATPLLVAPEIALTTQYTGSQYVLASSGATSALATLSATVAQDAADGYVVSFNRMNSAPPSGAAAGCSASSPTACRIYVAFQLSSGSGSCGGGVYYAPVYDSATSGVGVATITTSLPSPCVSNLTATVVQNPVTGNGSYLYWTPGAAAVNSITIAWPGTTDVMGNGSVADPSSGNGVDNFVVNSMDNPGINGLVGISTLSYSSTYGAACMTSAGNTSAPVNVQIASVSLAGMSQNTALNELQLSAYAVVSVTDATTGLPLCSFIPGLAPNFFVTVVDSKTVAPGYYGAQVYLSNGSLYKSIAGTGPNGTVALDSGRITVHLK